MENQRPVLDDNGQQVGVKTAGFLGISATAPYQQQSIGAAITRTGDFIGAAAKAVVAIPARIPALWSAILDGQPRDLNSPVGIVGAGRIGGEILESDSHRHPGQAGAVPELLAGFNMSLFLLNMLPLLPLDGGHIFGAVIEWVRRGWAKLRRKAGPGPVRRGQADAGRLRRGVVVHRVDRADPGRRHRQPGQTVRLSRLCRANCHVADAHRKPSTQCPSIG